MLFSENNADILYNEITGAYLDRGYMHGEGLTKDQVNRSRDLFKAMAYDLIDRGDETGRIHTPEILAVWTNHLHTGNSEPEDGWLQHCYMFLRNQLFPHLPGPADADAFRQQRKGPPSGDACGVGHKWPVNIWNAIYKFSIIF